MKNILVTGATGFLGKIIIETLLKKINSNQINVISRNSEKIVEFQEKGFNAFQGDYNDLATLESAMFGVDTVLLISGGDQGDRMQEHRNVIDTAKKMGITNIAYTSRALQDRTTLQNKLMKDHFETEDYIKKSGLNYIIFQNGLYMEFLQFFISKDQIEKGLFLPTGEGRVAFTFRADQAEAIGKILLTEKFDKKTYQFTNIETYSFFDVAKYLSELSGKEIIYTPVEFDAFSEKMKQRGLPATSINKIYGFFTDIKNNQETLVTDDLENILGRKPTTLKDGLKIMFNF